MAKHAGEAGPLVRIVGLNLLAMKTPSEFIVFAIKQAKEAEKFGFTRNECCHSLKSALHQYWQNKTMHLSSISQKRRILRSKAAENRPLKECRVEHTVRLSIIVNRLMDMESPTTAAVIELLNSWYVVKLVTSEEDKRLTESGLRYAMPHGWDGSDIFARYTAVGIQANHHKTSATHDGQPSAPRAELNPG